LMWKLAVLAAVCAVAVVAATSGCTGQCTYEAALQACKDARGAFAHTCVSFASARSPESFIVPKGQNITGQNITMRLTALDKELNALMDARYFLMCKQNGFLAPGDECDHPDSVGAQDEMPQQCCDSMALGTPYPGGEYYFPLGYPAATNPSITDGRGYGSPGMVKVPYTGTFGQAENGNCIMQPDGKRRCGFICDPLSSSSKGGMNSCRYYPWNLNPTAYPCEACLTTCSNWNKNNCLFGEDYETGPCSIENVKNDPGCKDQMCFGTGPCGL